MKPEGGTPAKAEQGAQQHDQVEPNPHYVRTHDPDPGHVRARAHYSAMLAELLGRK
ncbi:hypothetical protein [Janthinobacterium sp. UMAB-56]|uniref:hypothetical protein n=1 Tax=Janthinobacterium sp. UMAB-56 TaxID=1365361 RepID=UPI001C59E6CF|nr:hypothetical protein [Janthinobacterium sp. UMAB-56]